MGEIAEKLTRDAERMQQELRGDGEIERLRAELQELRQAVRKLNARLDGENRERKESKER
jgi:ubiquinone biosynthesis protein UbiJ